jgi:hypothetical protein
MRYSLIAQHGQVSGPGKPNKKQGQSGRWKMNSPRKKAQGRVVPGGHLSKEEKSTSKGILGEDTFGV